VLSAPLMIALTAVSAVRHPLAAEPVHWLAFAYLAAVSMFGGFVVWYRGLAIGPMAQVSQIQLVQPVMSIAWAALLLGEQIGWQTIVGSLAIIACAALAVRTRLGPRARPGGEISHPRLGRGERTAAHM